MDHFPKAAGFNFTPNGIQRNSCLVVQEFSPPVKQISTTGGPCTCERILAPVPHLLIDPRASSFLKIGENSLERPHSALVPLFTLCCYVLPVVFFPQKPNIFYFYLCSGSCEAGPGQVELGFPNLRAVFE